MKELPKRKPNRLKDYDYSQNGAYFVTICAHERHVHISASAAIFPKTNYCYNLFLVRKNT